MHHSQHSLCTGLPYWWSHSLYITTVYSTWWPLSVLSGGPPDDLCTVITACCAFQSIWWPLSVISPLYCTNAHSDPFLVTSLCTIFTECCTLWPPLFTYCTVSCTWWPHSVPLSLYVCCTCWPSSLYCYYLVTLLVTSVLYCTRVPSHSSSQSNVIRRNSLTNDETLIDWLFRKNQLSIENDKTRMLKLRREIA